MEVGLTVDDALIQLSKPVAGKVPGVGVLGKCAPSHPKALAKGGVFEQFKDPPGEALSIISDQQMLAVTNREALATERGGHHRLGHRERLDNLESGATTHSDRHSNHVRAAKVRPDVRHPAENLNGGLRKALD